MAKLQFRTGFNVILQGYVDSLSKWDYFVDSCIHEYHKNKYSLSERERALLSDYVKARKELGWSVESELFDWAYGGFKTDKRFEGLLPTIRHFEELDGLADELRRSAGYNSQIMAQIEELLGSHNAGELLLKFGDVFDPKGLPDIIPAYLTYTPEESWQGGSNGMGIYTQVYMNADQKQEAEHCAGILFHEYIHKALQPGRFFRKQMNDDGYYTSVQKDIYPNDLGGFVEEVIVYSLSNVITFGEDPAQKAQKYLNDQRLTGEKRYHYKHLWETIGEAVPIIKKYLDNEIDTDAFLKSLDRLFRKIGDTKFLTDLADQNRLKATTLLDKLGLVSFLHEFGTINTLGSYAYDCMIRKDIDIYLTTPELPGREVVEKFVSALIKKGYQTVGFADHHTFRVDKKPDGYYIELIVREADGEWKFDIWILRPDEELFVKAKKISDTLSKLIAEPKKRHDLLILKSRFEIGMTHYTDKYKMYAEFIEGSSKL